MDTKLVVIGVLRVAPLLMLIAFVSFRGNEILETPIAALPKLVWLCIVWWVANLTANKLAARRRREAGRRSMRAAVGVYGDLPPDTNS